MQLAMMVYTEPEIVDRYIFKSVTEQDWL